MTTWRALTCLALACAACQSSSPPSAEPAQRPAASAARASNTKTYGTPISASDASKAALTDVLASPAKFKDKQVLVEGDVRRACSRKGCWMELASSMDGAQPGCRITFKDYGFFVPTDSAGARARVQGSVVVQTLPAANVQHMESEGAHFASKNPDGSADEVRMVATGVELTKS